MPVSQHLQQAQALAQEHSAVAACETRELGSKNEISINAVYMERNSKLENTCETKISKSIARCGSFQPRTVEDAEFRA